MWFKKPNIDKMVIERDIEGLSEALEARSVNKDMCFAAARALIQLGAIKPLHAYVLNNIIKLEFKVIVIRAMTKSPDIRFLETFICFLEACPCLAKKYPIGAPGSSFVRPHHMEIAEYLEIVEALKKIVGQPGNRDIVGKILLKRVKLNVDDPYDNPAVKDVGRSDSWRYLSEYQRSFQIKDFKNNDYIRRRRLCAAELLLEIGWEPITDEEKRAFDALQDDGIVGYRIY